MPLPPELQDTYRNYWQLVQQAATTLNEDGSYAYQASDVVSVASEIAQSAGQRLSFGTSAQLFQLFSVARGNSRASDELMNAGSTTTIDSSMIGSWPTQASVDVQAAQPLYMAKGQFTYINALGEQVSGWVTLTGITQVPPSVGNLTLRLQGAAQSAYSVTPEEGGSPTTDAEVMAEFGDFTSIQLYAV